MQQLFSNSKRRIGAIAVVALLGGALFGAAIAESSGDTNDGSGSSGANSGESAPAINQGWHHPAW